MSLSVLYLCVFEALVFEWSSCTRLKGINHVPRCSFLVKTWLTQNLACFLVSGQRKCDETWDVIHLSLTLEEIHRSNFEHARQWVDFLSVRSVVRSSYLCSSVCVPTTNCVYDWFNVLWNPRHTVTILICSTTWVLTCCRVLPQHSSKDIVRVWMISISWFSSQDLTSWFSETVLVLPEISSIRSSSSHYYYYLRTRCKVYVSIHTT